MIFVVIGFSFLDRASLIVTLELGILTFLRRTVMLGQRLEQTFSAHRSHLNLSIIIKVQSCLSPIFFLAKFLVLLGHSRLVGAV